MVIPARSYDLANLAGIALFAAILAYLFGGLIPGLITCGAVFLVAWLVTQIGTKAKSSEKTVP
jgi:hypothetical protein